jgi:hypothetical protein
MMVIVVPSCLYLVVNLRIFVSIRSLSRRIQLLPTSIVTITDQSPQQKISHHDIRLLLHTISMFSMFIFAWGPIFTLTLVDYDYKVASIIYTLLTILAELSLLLVIVHLFFYNRTLRRYLRNGFRWCC